MQLTITFFSSIARILLCACLLVMLPAHAKRLALVMGNDNYTSVTKLQKAGNDATAMARELKAAGFTVQLHKDLNYRGMVKAVETFTNTITGGDEVVVFFAGHGVQIKNGSYLLPTDIEASSEKEVEKTAYELLALTDMISEAKPAFSLVMIDACRDNPLKASGRSVGNARGLSAVEPPKGQMVVYSASRGQQALDRLNDSDANPNSVFTREFIQKMSKPGVKIEDILRDVQDSVESLAKTVKHDQRPAIYNEARGNFYFFGPTTVQVQPSPKPEPVSPSARPGQVEGMNLADLEREEATRKEWATWQNRMKADFDKTAAFVGSTDLMVKAWERFLLVWSQDNPNSQDDESLRLQATGKRDAARQANLQSQQVVPNPELEKPVSTQRKEQSSTPIQVAQTPVSLKPGDVFKDCDMCPEMVVIPKGVFLMGSAPSGFLGLVRPADDETPQHKVSVESFAIGKFEVTQEEWAAIMASNPSYFKGNKLPVEQVQRSEIYEFLKKLSAKTGKNYRLPTEAEWEYAAKAGTNSTYFWGNDAKKVSDYTWWKFNSQKKTHPVGEKLPNQFGLHDMLGNVMEWTLDCWASNYLNTPVDGRPYSVTNCNVDVIRGGSWASTELGLTTTYRTVAHYGLEGEHLGFRVVSTP